MTAEKTFEEKHSELEFNAYDTLTKVPMNYPTTNLYYMDGQYNLEGSPSQFFAIWKRKMAIFSLWNEEWDRFFKALEYYITSITFSHRQGFILRPNNARDYYPIDRMFYTCRTDERIHVSYCNQSFLGGTMDENESREDQWKFGAWAPWIGLWPFTIKYSTIRETAKTDFFGTLTQVEQKYHLGLFLLTFENVLICSPTTRQGVACSMLCKHVCKNIQTNCVIL